MDAANMSNYATPALSRGVHTYPPRPVRRSLWANDYDQDQFDEEWDRENVAPRRRDRLSAFSSSKNANSSSFSKRARFLE